MVSYGISFCLTPVCGGIAKRLNIVDKPDARKLHLEATPLLGGVAIFIGLIMAVYLNGICTKPVCVILMTAAVLFVTGVMDDIAEIAASLKMIIQLAVTAVVIFFGVQLRVIPEALGTLSVAGNTLLTVLWIIGITNAMNFFDGMDGLAGGLGTMIAFFLGLIAFHTSQPYLGWVSVAVMGSCLGFLPYNLKGSGRASIFLGDAGSTTIGYILACIAVYGEWASNNPVVSLVSPLLIFWVLIFDMVYITGERILSGKVANVREWLDYVGQDHLHHRLAQVIGSQKKSVVFIYLLTMCLGISALVLQNAGALDAVLLVLQAVILVVLISVLEWHGRFGPSKQ
jgi:UDP-GlcNAc:undecaprenyl-phosphate GlcNAc-1-phosphate transferase